MTADFQQRRDAILVHGDFPPLLKQVPDAPERLYLRGEIPTGSPVIAVVGSRAASGHGLHRAHELAVDLATRGALVISGGAVGVDAAAHVGTMSAGKATLVVLATSLEAPYPARHRPLFRQIVDRGGSLLSCMQPGVPLQKWHFLRRNRILAGLADAVIVVEASVSSGSLYTAEAALDYGRVLGACPGTPGTESLLRQGAAVVESAEDVFAALRGVPRILSVSLPEAGTDEARALAALGQSPRGVDSLSVALGLDSGRIASALSALELEGLAQPVPGGRYVRSDVAERLCIS